MFGFRELAQLFLVVGNGLLLELRVSLLKHLKLGVDQVYHGQISIDVDCLAVSVCHLVVHGLKLSLHDLLTFLLDVRTRFVDLNCDLRAKLLDIFSSKS